MAAPWNHENAAHLLRKAAFGGRPEEVEQAVALGKEGAVQHLLAAVPEPDPIPQAALKLARMQGWWIVRMATTAAPLREKLALFLHDHFATGLSKVKKKALMHAQNQKLRALGLGRFRDLLRAMARDPALLLWLDNHLNVKASPNENFARELMELFSTGVADAKGDAHYTEKDVSECARAFTGWTVVGDAFQFSAADHDFGTKKFKGVTANFDGGDVVDLLAADAATARRLAAKLWSFFAFPIELDDPLAIELANVYLAHDTALEPMLRHLFLHDAFYAEPAHGAVVKSPAEFLASALHLLGVELSQAPKLWKRIGLAATALGQALFEPPSVFGWPGGTTWVEVAGLHQRLVAATWIAAARPGKKQAVTFDPAPLLGDPAEWSALGGADVVARVLAALGPLDAHPSTVAALVEYVAEGLDSFELTPAIVDQKVRGAVALALASPEFQLA